MTAIIHNPELVVLDEPFSGLDPVNTEILKNIIIDLVKNGKYVINNDTIKLSTTGRTITIYNRPKVDFTLIKLDKIDNSAIKNILFNIKIQNAKSGPTNIIADDLSDFDIYTDTNGKINISYEENPLYCEVVIKDSGEGIDKKDLPHIFKRFYKGKSSKDDSVGIGLAMAKSIIESQNGDIYVKSEKNKGSEFHIIFHKTYGD